MIKINNAYLNQFKLSHHEYLYFISKGIYLAFDHESHEYIGIEMFYLPRDMGLIQQTCDNKLNELISSNILELSYEN